MKEGECYGYCSSEDRIVKDDIASVADPILQSIWISFQLEERLDLAAKAAIAGPNHEEEDSCVRRGAPARDIASTVNCIANFFIGYFLSSV